jgi:N,N'-diacetyllegionaminate synthase
MMKIAKKNIGDRVFIIAEIGNNHEGSFTLAQDMISAAASTGVDAVKFQTYIPELFVSKNESKTYERLKKFQLSFDQFKDLSELATSLGLVFFSTPLDLESARFLNTIQPIFKIASSDNSFFQLLELVASFQKPVIVSTGMSDFTLLDKVRETILKYCSYRSEPEKLAFLHCTTAYPTPPREVNLRAINSLIRRYSNCLIGYSDHTLGNSACLYAVAAGARIIEKHFTLDKNYSDFRDHQLSADVFQMTTLVNDIRNIEEYLGSGEKALQSSEVEIEPIVRRSIIAITDIPENSVITRDHITYVRPGTGIRTNQESLVLNKVTSCFIRKGTFISIEQLKDDLSPS